MEREWGLNWNSCQPATNMFLNEYNKIKSLTAVVTPSRVPWCSCSTDCPMCWDCLGGNPGEKLVLQNCGIMSSTWLQPPLKSSYQKVGCAVCSCAGFQRNQSLTEGFFWESWGKKKKKKSTVEIETDTRGALWMLVLALGGQQTFLKLLPFFIWKHKLFSSSLIPIHGISFGFFAQFSAACRKQDPLVGRCGQYWGCHSNPVYNPVLY